MVGTHKKTVIEETQMTVFLCIVIGNNQREETKL